MDIKARPIEPLIPSIGMNDEGALPGRSSWKAMVVQDARVFKSGNSLAIRIPNAIAKHAQIQDGAAVEMVAENGVILMRKPRTLQLDELIARITPENMHTAEFDTLGASEIW